MITTLFSQQYKLLRIAPYVFTALAAFILFYKTGITPIKTDITNPICMSQACKKQAEQNYRNALEAIRIEFNIPTAEWEKAHREFLEACSANQDLFAPNIQPKKTRDELKNLIHNALANAGINPDKVHIKYMHDEAAPVITFQDYTSATRLKHSIEINKKWFTQHSNELQHAIINHEIMHLKNFDCIEYGFIIKVLKQHRISDKQMDASPALQNFRHMRELRADLLAGASDVNIAKAFHQDFCNCVARNYQEDLNSHPSSQTRLNQMAQLLNKMEIEQNIKLA